MLLSSRSGTAPSKDHLESPPTARSARLGAVSLAQRRIPSRRAGLHRAAALSARFGGPPLRRPTRALKARSRRGSDAWLYGMRGNRHTHASLFPALCRGERSPQRDKSSERRFATSFKERRTPSIQLAASFAIRRALARSIHPSPPAARTGYLSRGSLVQRACYLRTSPRAQSGETLPRP